MALVITIIVILILAGVTIQTLTGNNGLLTKAETAVQSNKDSQELEKIKLAVAAAQLVGEGTIFKDNLEYELRNNFNDNSIIVKEKTDGWTFNNYQINMNGSIGKMIYLYNQGEECIELTGGWGTNTKWTPNRPVIPLRKSDDRVLLYGTHAKYSILLTNNDIDMTNYKRICFKLKSISTYSTYPNVIMKVLKERDSNVAISAYNNYEIGDLITCELDISDIEGAYPLMILVNGVEQYKSELLSVWLETN